MIDSVSIIIVSYNTGDLLPACLDSIAEQSLRSTQVIVIDNASTDGTPDMLRVHYPEVVCIANRENRGFAAANNQGLSRCHGELIFFLNPDTVLRPGCLTCLAQFMEAQPEVGLAGPMILDVDGRRHSSVECTYPGHRYTRGELADLPGDIAWLLGAALVGRKTVVMQLHGFDEHFFLYGEDIDICLRTRQLGWRLGFVEDAEVVHIEGQSERTAAPAEVFERKYRAELKFMAKHYSGQSLKAIDRARRFQASWRLLTLRLTAPFSRDGGVTRNKLEKYRIIKRVHAAAFNSVQS